MSSKLFQTRRIPREEFFYVVNDDYDEHAELAIPHYIQLHNELASIVLHSWGCLDPLRLLDLGGGTGKTTGVILSEYPRGTAVVVDLFEEMLQHGRKRLADFGERVKFVQGDFMNIDLGSGYDVCVSSLAIHHQDALGKRELFRRIYQALVPGGRFFMIDWTKFDEPRMHELALYVAAHNVREKVSRAEIVAAWIDHWRRLNIPDTIEDMCSWLREVGFVHADCAVRYYGMGLIYAVKEK